MLDRELRNSKEYFAWRKEIYEKYKHKCDVSGKILMEPVAHHLKPFKELINEWRNEEDDFYKKILWHRIFDVDNGVVMSNHLHKKYHSQYKWRINEETYKEFKENWRKQNDMAINYPIKTYKLWWWLEVVEIN